MPIRWKVVTKQRESVIIDKKDYRLRYEKGIRVKAHENTIGIAVFETRKQAEKIRNFGLDRQTLRVNGIGRGIKPKHRIPYAFNSDAIEETIVNIKRLGLTKFLKILTRGWRVPEGTILYKEVEVLE